MGAAIVVVAVLLGSLGVVMYQRNEPARTSGPVDGAQLIRIMHGVGRPEPSASASAARVAE
jgi:hypothetical protein